jgi:hypothetical protein
MTMTVTPRCAHCTDPITLVGQVVTNHAKTYIICGNGGCEQWAWAQGLSPAGWAARPSVSRRHKTCAHCHGELPRRTTDRWGDAGGYCTLTCQQRAT